MATFDFQLLLLWFVARGGSGVWIFLKLYKTLVPLLILPVCEDLEGREFDGTCAFTMDVYVHGDDSTLPVSAPPGL